MTKKELKSKIFELYDSMDDIANAIISLENEYEKQFGVTFGEDKEEDSEKELDKRKKS